jgi:Zn-dependent protease with chaperone function
MRISWTVCKKESGGIASTTGILWWKRLNLSSAFFRQPDRTKEAILAHEVCHMMQFHLEQRLLCIVLCPFLLFKLCRQQEIWADNFAARLGFAKELIAFLSSEYDGDLVQPSHAVRRKNLEKYV